MNSGVYECHVMHARFSPRPHRFLYRIFLFAINLDELDALPRRLALFSVNRANLYSLREQDYLPTGEPLHNSSADKCHLLDDTSAGLKQRVVACLADRGVDPTGGRVVLVALPRALRYRFNPSSFNSCCDGPDRLGPALAELGLAVILFTLPRG